MIFYRLALERLIEYFQLDHLFDDDEQRQILLHKKPKKIYRTQLRTNKKLNLCVSTLLSLLSMVLCLTLPFAALETPCNIFKSNYLIYNTVKWIESHMPIIDRFIIALLILLIYVALTTVMDAIKNTNISMSPWVERGKYAGRKRRTL